MTKQKPFVVLRGTVSGLRTQSTHVNPLMNSREQEMSASIAILQSLVGLPGAVSTAQLANYEGDPVEGFVMTVNGKHVVGYLWRVGFKDGDEVEVVGNDLGEFFDAVAVTKPDLRNLCVRPHHLYGTRAFVRAEHRRILKFVLTMGGLMYVGAATVGAFSKLESKDWIAGFYVISGSLILLNVMALFIQRTPRDIADFSLKVEAVGRALGLPSPELIDLPANNRTAYKKGKPVLRSAYYY